MKSIGIFRSPILQLEMGGGRWYLPGILSTKWPWGKSVGFLFCFSTPYKVDVSKLLESTNKVVIIIIIITTTSQPPSPPMLWKPALFRLEKAPRATPKSHPSRREHRVSVWSPWKPRVPRAPRAQTLGYSGQERLQILRNMNLDVHVWLIILIIIVLVLYHNVG